MPTLTDTLRTFTRVHEIVYRTPDWFDWLTVLLPILSGVFLFLAGFYGNRVYENWKEKNRLNDVKEYFLTLAEFLGNVLQVQSTIIREDVFKIKSMAAFDISVTIFPELNTNRIKAISDLDLYKIFITNKGQVKTDAQLLNTLSSSIDSIDTIKFRLNQLNQELLKEVLLYNDRYNITANALADADNSIIIRDGFTNAVKSREAFNLHLIYVECSREFAGMVIRKNISVSDTTKRYEYFIKPLFDKTRHIKEEEFTNTILLHIGKLNYDYSNFLLVKDTFITAFNDLADNCEKISGEVHLLCARLNPSIERFPEIEYDDENHVSQSK